MKKNKKKEKRKDKKEGQTWASIDRED